LSYPYYIGRINKNIFEPPKYYLRTLINNTTIWETTDLLNPKIFGELIFSESIIESIICCYELKSLKILWQLDTSKIFGDLKLSRFIGVHQNILLVGLGTTTDVDNYIVAINIDTGEIIWKVKTSIIQHVLIDKRNNMLRSIISKYYFEVDIFTGKLSKIKYKDVDEDFNSQRTNFVQVDSHLITTDWKKGKIGAFNTETHQFDWLHEEEGLTFPGGSPMLYKAPYLFVQDNKHTVHVFEKINQNT